MAVKPSDYTQANRFIKIETDLGKDVLLLERFKGTERISGLFRYTLDLLAVDNTKVKFETLLGKVVKITMTQLDGKPRHFQGVVSRLSQDNPVTSRNGAVSFYRYHAEVVPKVWLLTRTVRSRVFQHKSVPEILTTVFQGYDTRQQLDSTYEPRDYCVQYNESDFDFASRLMEEEGIYYFFAQTESAHQMHIVDSAQNLSNIPGKSPEVRYRRKYGDLAEDEVIVQWEKSQEIRSGKYTLRDRNFELTSNLEASSQLKETLTVGTVSHKLKVENNEKLEIYSYPGGYATRFDNKDRTGGDSTSVLNKVFQDNTRVAKLRMQAEALPAVSIYALGNCTRFSAGMKFKLKDHFDADGTYLLSRIDHLASVSDSYLGGSSEGFSYGNTFQCSPADLPYTPDRQTPRPRIEGPQTAVVVGQEGDEIFTDPHGRVKVQFYWDRDSKNDPDSSCWVRVGSIWAGKNWGGVHIPRVGQEVIVSFLDGDPDRPIIVGSVYNGENPPPYTLPDNKTQSGIKSRSSLKGGDDNFNELRFEDKKDNELVYFHAEKDFERVVENNDTLTVGVDGSSSLKDGNQKITVYKDRTATIKTGNESLTVDKGNRTVTVSEGNDKHEVTRGKRDVIVESDDTHQVKTGNRTTTIDTGNDTHTIKTGNRTVTLDMGNDSLTLKMGNQSIELKLGNQSTKCAVGSSTTEALQGITLKSGPSSIQITPSGITLKGLMVQIQGQAMCTVKAPIVQAKADGILMLKGGITIIG